MKHKAKKIVSEAMLFRAVTGCMLMLLFGINTTARAQTGSAWTFSLLPSNMQIAGDAGTTIGWGYSITNNSTYWLLPFTLATDSTFQHATVTTNPFDYPALAPGTTVTTP